jgi:AcrR family transcriptional regulator
VPRVSQFSREALLAHAVRLAAESGHEAVTMAGVAEAAQAPSGSVYYRFDGRPALLAELWIEVVTHFQAWWWPRAEAHDDVGAVAALPVEWARRHADLARVLLLHRADELIRPEAPVRLRRRAKTVTRETRGRFATLALRFVGSRSAPAVERTIFALASIPLAAVREPLAARRAIAPSLTALVREAAAALMRRP